MAESPTRRGGEREATGAGAGGKRGWEQRGDAERLLPAREEAGGRAEGGESWFPIANPGVYAQGSGGRERERGRIGHLCLKM